MPVYVDIYADVKVYVCVELEVEGKAGSRTYAVGVKATLAV